MNGKWRRAARKRFCRIGILLLFRAPALATAAITALRWNSKRTAENEIGAFAGKFPNRLR